jgi:hypothetical protein
MQEPEKPTRFEPVDVILRGLTRKRVACLLDAVKKPSNLVAELKELMHMQALNKYFPVIGAVKVSAEKLLPWSKTSVFRSTVTKIPFVCPLSLDEL